MSKYQRIIIEVLAPPFLAAAIVAATDKSDTFLMILGGFLPFLLCAYLFGIIPSALYALAMEFWFQKGAHSRCGLLCTLGLSALLGGGAGFLSASLGSGLGFTRSDGFYFVRIGTLIGLLIGVYVGTMQASGAQPGASPNGGPATPSDNSVATEGPPSVS